MFQASFRVWLCPSYQWHFFRVPFSLQSGLYMLSETLIYKYGKIVLNKGKDVALTCSMRMKCFCVT